jgi:uncharacterized protein DUF4124
VLGIITTSLEIIVMEIKITKTINKLTIVTFLSLVSLNSYSEVYKWTDENGKTHYGDKPSELDNTEDISDKLPTDNSYNSSLTKPPVLTLKNAELITEHVLVDINNTAHLPYISYRLQEPLLPDARFLTVRAMNDSLWFSGNTGLVEFELNSGQWLHYDSSHKLPGDMVSDLEVDFDKLILEVRDWTGANSLSSARYYSFSSGRFRESEKKVKDVRAGGRFTTDNSDLQRNDFADSIHSGGYTWVSTYGDKRRQIEGGVYKLKPVSKQGKFYSVKNGLAHDYCYSLVQTKDRSIWVSHWEEERGLSVLRHDRRNWEVITHSKEGIELGGVDINAIEHILLIGQQRALVIYDTESGHAYSINEAMGLPGYIVSDVYVDKNKIAWITAYTYGSKGQSKAGLMKIEYADMINLFKKLKSEALDDMS